MNDVSAESAVAATRPAEAPTASNPPPPPPSSRHLAPALPEEIDVWWGSYSGWTMTPSLLVCAILTVGLWLAVRYWVPLDYRKLAFLALGAAIWIVQGVRWAGCFFGYNYRLTSRRLFRDRGFLNPDMRQTRLDAIARVEVRRGFIENLLRVARIYVFFEDAGQPPLVLDGVRHADSVAELIRDWRQIAREMKDSGPHAAVKTP